MSSDRQDILLHEYGYCDMQIGRLDSLIWQTGSVVFPITLAGFAYFSSSSTHSIDQFFVVLAVAVGSITLTAIWYLLSRLWFRFQSIAFYRMREIEDELELWRFRYSAFMGRPGPERKLTLRKIKGPKKPRLQSLNNQIGDFHGVGLRPAAAYVTAIFISGWIALIIREYVLTFRP